MRELAKIAMMVTIQQQSITLAKTSVHVDVDTWLKSIDSATSLYKFAAYKAAFQVLMMITAWKTDDSKIEQAKVIFTISSIKKLKNPFRLWLKVNWSVPSARTSC